MNQVIISRGEHHVALAAVRSLGKKNIKTTIVSEFENAMSFYSKYCDNYVISDGSIDFFQRFSKNDLIFPLEENLMIELTKNKSKYRCPIAFPEYPILELILNKSMLVDHAKENGIPCPETVFARNVSDYRENLDQIRFPVVIKPVRSFGGVGISFVDSGNLVEKIVDESIQKFGPLLIQEKIPYRERYSVAILMNQDQVMKNCCVLMASRSYPVHAGPATVVESVDRPDLVDLGNTLLQSINYSGVAEIEFVIDERDNSPKLMEINPRLWGSLQGAINAGVDFPFLLYKLYQDGDIEKNLHYRKGVRTRNVIGNDHQHLGAILRGNYPISMKTSTVIEFLKMYQDDGYYIFDPDDIRPFMHHAFHTTRRILKRSWSHR